MEQNNAEKTAIEFMDIIGNSIVDNYIKRKKIVKKQQKLLKEICLQTITTKIKTGSWVEKLSDGQIAKKNEETGKYVSTPELEKERLAILIPNGLRMMLETPLNRMLKTKEKQGK